MTAEPLTDVWIRLLNRAESQLNSGTVSPERAALLRAYMADLQRAIAASRPGSVQ